MSDRVTMWETAQAYRRLVDFRMEMQNAGRTEFAEGDAHLYYPGGLEQFKADAATMKEANRQFEQAERDLANSAEPKG